jgi:hypothetical protein
MSETVQTRPTTPTAAPYSSLIRVAAGVCLILAALTNGLSQYLGYLVIGDRDWVDQVRWGADHLTIQRTEQMALVVSALFMPIGLLALAQVTRWSSRRLTLIAVPLMLWGMWGFHNILAIGYIAGTAGPQILGVDAAVKFNEEMVSDPGAALLGLLPHLLGSFLGIVLLTIAAWRSGHFPKAACALILAFLVWDFLLQPVGPLEPHLLLFIGWSWLGVALIRMPQPVWSGALSAAPPPGGSADDGRPGPSY